MNRKIIILSLMAILFQMKNSLAGHEQTRFCVISPTYKTEGLTTKAVQSVMNQNYENWHMHVIDDASPDNIYGELKYFIDENRSSMYNMFHILKMKSIL